MSIDQVSHIRGWLLREPLVHFALASVLIFALFAALRGEESSNQHITITLAQVEQLALVWERTWGRPPTDEELQSAVRDRIKDEVYYREALRLGLDANDTVIRRRLRQKLEYFIVEQGTAPVPDDATLKAWLTERSDQYQEPARYTFRQIYFAEEDQDRINAALAALDAGDAPSTLGDQISLPADVADAPSHQIARTFGERFTQSLEPLPEGQWAGPVRSGFGWHLVRITQRTPEADAAFADVRQQVARDWQAQARAQSEEAGYQLLRDRYTIEIEQPSK